MQFTSASKNSWMNKQISMWEAGRFSQNFLFRRPLAGSAIVGLFCLVFLLLYKPLDIRSGPFLDYELAVTLYSVVGAFSVWGTTHLLKQTGRFGKAETWSVQKELVAIFVILSTTGVAIYFSGFLVFGPSEQWSIPALVSSFLHTYLILGVPVFFFTALNVYALLQPVAPSAVSRDEAPLDLQDELEPDEEMVEGEMIELETPLKNEELRFYPGELVYAYSEGNYVVFCLDRDGEVQEEIVRCTLSSVEEQLVAYPFLLRTHRTYIVNLHKVDEAYGNALGYRLRIPMVEEDIPVARSRTRAFKDVYRQFG